MESLIDSHSYDWVLLPKEPYVMKFVVKNPGYHIVISNLTFIYGENIKETDVQKRFHELNPFADMKSDLILQNINSSLLEFLDNKCNHILKLDDNRFVLTLHFSARLLNYKYEVRMDLLPAEQIMSFIISPTVMGALLCERKIKELEKMLSTDKASSNLTANATSSITSVSSIVASLPSNFPESSKSKTNSDWKTQKVPAEMIVQTFAKLQKHFKQLASENIESFPSLKKEKVPSDVQKIEKINIQFPVPIEYEEETNSLEKKQVIKEACEPQEPVLKRSKIRNLKF